MSSSMTQPSLRRRVHETPFAPRTSSPASTQLDLPVNDIPEAGAPYTSADDFVGTTIWGKFGRIRFFRDASTRNR